MKNVITKSISFSNRYNLCIIKSKSEKIEEIIKDLGESIKSINVGREIARELSGKKLKHLTITVSELLNSITENNAKEVFKGKPKLIAFYNLGILFEPEIQLNVEKILKDLSRQYGIIVIWDSQIDDGPILHWGKQKEIYKINLSDTNPSIIDKTL